jgi:biotin carboxyl carrier protein
LLWVKGLRLACAVGAGPERSSRCHTHDNKHAKAALDYAKEESERIDIDHKKEMFPTKQRQEKAAAEKLEAEARTARINEIRARIELVKELREIGVVPQQDDQGNLRIMNAPAGFNWDGLLIRGLLDPAEEALIAHIENVFAPPLSGDHVEMKVVRLLKRPGDAVVRDEPILEISVASTASLVPCPTSGTLVELLVLEGEHIRHDQVVARIRPC